MKGKKKKTKNLSRIECHNLKIFHEYYHAKSDY